MPDSDDDDVADALWAEMLRAHKRGVLQAVVPADPESDSVRARRPPQRAQQVARRAKLFGEPEA
eukprot:1028751-Prymnesium_polylepis.1